MKYKKYYLIILLLIPLSYSGCSNTEIREVKKAENIDYTNINPDELLIIYYNRKEGFIDRQGNVIIEPTFEYDENFSEGLARIRTVNRYSSGGKSGYIDVYGNIVIEPIFFTSGRFSEGLAKVGIDGKFGYINKKGEIVIETNL